MLQLVPTARLGSLVAVLVAAAVARALAHGRSTPRDRDLHARTVLLTGAFSPLGLALLRALALRGATVIALDPAPVPVLVDLLRTTCRNERIYAEACNLADPADIRRVCTQFLSRDDTRLDGLVFAHEYPHTTSADEHDSKSLATFLITTLLLPVLLVAPAERDIRIINVVNPFYAAAVKRFTPAFGTKNASTLLSEGLRSLRTIVLTRHLQRILDALPKPQVPKPEDGSSAVPVTSSRMQKSNIVAVSVSPGISRLDTVSRLLNADWSLSGTSFSWFGVLLYMLLSPLLYILTKSPTASIQSVLHALFLPTPFKALSAEPTSKTELLKPGALYANCATIKLDIPVPDDDNTTENDDGEYGGQAVGTLVWEAYEAALKLWEKEHVAH